MPQGNSNYATKLGELYWFRGRGFLKPSTLVSIVKVVEVNFEVVLGNLPKVKDKLTFEKNIIGQL